MVTQKCGEETLQRILDNFGGNFQVTANFDHESEKPGGSTEHPPRETLRNKLLDVCCYNGATRVRRAKPCCGD